MINRITSGRRICTLLLLTLFSAEYATADNALSANAEAQARKEFTTETLYQLWRDSLDDAQSIPRFLKELPARHRVDDLPDDSQHTLITYFHHGSADTDYVMLSGGPDFFGLRFKQLGDSGLYFCTQRVPKNAFFNYGINEFTRSAGGGREPPHHDMQHVYDGAFIGPDAPLSKLPLAEPTGLTEEWEINSRHLGGSRKVSVYRPKSGSGEVTHNLIIQFDAENFLARPQAAEEWRGWTPMRSLIDSLQASKRIGPTIVVFVWNQDRRDQDLTRDEMADFVALELVPRLRKHYPISQDRHRLVASGPSRAGYAALNTAFRHPSIIGAAISQSGSFYYTLQQEENWPIYPALEGVLPDKLKKAEIETLRVHLDVGLYDLGLGRVGLNRQLRDILQLKGHKVSYLEYKGGHSHLNWRHTLEHGVLALLSDRDAP